MTDDDLWEAARERGRAQVREALRRSAPAEHTRVCPFCGQEGTTRREYCPHCGRSYFERPARLGPRARQILAAGALIALAVFAAWFVPTAVRFRHDSDADRRARQAALVAAERVRLTAEQRPHHGQATALRPAASASPAEQRAARRALVGRLERSITADARARVARRLLSGKPPMRSVCGPLARNQRVGDDQDLTTAIGRYSCVAVTSDVVGQGGRALGLYGIPFVASADFRHFTYVWCKDNPAGNVSEAKDHLAFVRLSRECLAARGRAFGTGYVDR